PLGVHGAGVAEVLVAGPPDGSLDKRRRLAARARETGDAKLPVIAAQDVVHVEENGRDHGVAGARLLSRLKSGATSGLAGARCRQATMAPSRTRERAQQTSGGPR